MKWFPLVVLTGLVAGTAGCGGDKAGEMPPMPDTPGGSMPSNAAAPSAAGPGPGSGPWAQPDASAYKTTSSGLTYAVIEPGKGPAVKAGQTAVMHYTGWLKNGGSKFDSSRDSGQPLDFVLGTGRVIKGWDEGVEGMLVGEKRQLVIPAALGYGDRGAGSDIPPGADLVFDVELVEIR